MIHVTTKDTKIYHEMNEENQNYWFDFKQRKYLHNIDTYYYSIKVNPENYDNFIEYLKVKKEEVLNEEYVELHDIGTEYIMNGYSFDMYRYDIELPDQFLIIIADKVPNDDTPEIIVQLRSYYLWMHGPFKAIEKSYEMVTEILDKFDITAFKVKSNRVDYCWHTNYVQDLNTFFNPSNIAQMRVSRLKEFDMHGVFKGDHGTEFDYLRLGRLKSNNIILRAYLKSKEVVEMGYKPWFFQIWLHHGLINRYDFYVYEECFKKRNWDHLHKARLEYYLEFGTDTMIKTRIELFFAEEKKTGLYKYDQVKAFADEITPRVNMIINFEFQTKRKFYSNLNYKNTKGRTGLTAEIFTELDNRRLMLDFLTHDTIRFVKKNQTERKERRDYAPFWCGLRRTQIVDAPVPNENLKFFRIYKNTLDRERIKDRAAKSVITYNILKNNTDTTIREDIVDVLTNLNDNDIFRLQMYKRKKAHQLKLQIPDDVTAQTSPVLIINQDTGEILS